VLGRAFAPACWKRAWSISWQRAGVGERMAREGQVHEGINIAFSGRSCIASTRRP
jgi:hypothetical protein